jgi:hypothetical protein
MNGASVDSLRGRADAIAFHAAPDARPPLRLLKLNELLEHPFREREPILGDWLLTSGLAMIHSWRGVGKTHTALGVAYAAASGGTFLRWKAPKPRRVFYIDGEMPGASLALRMAAIVANSAADADPANFTVLTPDAQAEGMPDLATPEGQEEIDAAIRACDAELIVVDNLSCLVRGGKPENDAESWQPVQTWALSHRKEGRTILFIHHSGKNGAQRGTSRREDILDTVIALKRPGDYSPTEGARFEVHFEKHRNDKGDSAKTFEARLGEDVRGQPVWTMCDLEEGSRAKVLEMKGLGMSATEIASELGIHRSTVYRNFKEAT